LPVHLTLSHRAGLPAIRRPLPPEAMFEWTTVTASVAAEEPWWEPGAKHGYHLITFGWLVGEVVRRASGRTLGTFFRDEIATPLGVDCHIGLSADHDRRTADVIPHRFRRPATRSSRRSAIPSRWRSRRSRIRHGPPTR